MSVTSIQSANLSFLSQYRSGQTSTSAGQLGLYALEAYAVRKSREQLPSDQANDIGVLYEKLSALQEAGATLDTTDRINHAFIRQTATSSDEGVLTASVSAGAAAGGGATEATYSIEVQQLATKQVNSGAELTDDDPTTLTAGTHSLQVDINGSSHTISYTIGASDTNETALAAITQAINDADVGIEAEVVSSAGLGTSRLVLSSANTGTPNAFTVSDVTGNAISGTGVGAATTAAANALYSVDGISRTSSSNTIFLDNAKVSATLSDTTTDPVSLTVGANEESTSSAITSFVSAFNSLREHLSSSSAFYQDGLAQAMDNLTSRLETRLKDIGITVDDTGQLSVDEDTLNAQLEDNFEKVKSAIGGWDGLATRSGRFAQEVHSTPSYQLLKNVEPSGSSPSVLSLLKGDVLYAPLTRLFT